MIEYVDFDLDSCSESLEKAVHWAFDDSEEYINDIFAQKYFYKDLELWQVSFKEPIGVKMFSDNIVDLLNYSYQILLESFSYEEYRDTCKNIADFVRMKWDDAFTKDINVQIFQNYYDFYGVKQSDFR